MSTGNSQSGEHCVRFERPLAVSMMTIDGTSCVSGFLIEISDAAAEIKVVGCATESAEFFLILTSFGDPVYRRCRREWVHGETVGVSFRETAIGLKSSARTPEERLAHHEPTL